MINTCEDLSKLVADMRSVEVLGQGRGLITKKEMAMEPYRSLDLYMIEDSEPISVSCEFDESDMYVKSPAKMEIIKARGAEDSEDHGQKLKEEGTCQTKENPLGVDWDHYYFIIEAREQLIDQGYIPLLGKQDGKWCFRVYGKPCPEKQIMGVPIFNIPAATKFKIRGNKQFADTADDRERYALCSLPADTYTNGKIVQTIIIRE